MPRPKLKRERAAREDCVLKRFTAVFVAFVMTAGSCCVAEDTGATLRTQGNVSVGGNPAPPFSTVFPNTLIETQKNASAILELTGSRIEIGPETVVEFDGGELRLEHGSLSVLTFRSMIVKVGCILAIPVRSEETLFEIANQTGRVTISAIRNDVNIKSALKTPKSAADFTKSEEITVHQGEQKSRDEKCGPARYETRAAPAAIRGWLNSPYAQGVAAGGTVGLLCWLFCNSNNPASPSIP